MLWSDREKHSMDQCRSRPKLSENFESHWSIPFPGEIHMDQSLVHTFSWGNSYGPMVLKVLWKFPPTLVLVHGWLFPVWNTATFAMTIAWDAKAKIAYNSVSLKASTQYWDARHSSTSWCVHIRAPALGQTRMCVIKVLRAQWLSQPCHCRLSLWQRSATSQLAKASMSNKHFDEVSV